MLGNADGTESPVFKAFADDHAGPVGRIVTDARRRPLWRPDAVWRRQTDTVRETLRRDFDRVLAALRFNEVDRSARRDSTASAPYGCAHIPPSGRRSPSTCRRCGSAVLASASAPGFDSIVRAKRPEPDSCYRPPAFLPPATIDWNSADDRERAARLALWQIEASMRTSLDLQIDPTLPNARAGFFAVYIATFNEWHEGTSFEPMKDHAALLPEELPRLSQSRERALPAGLSEAAAGAASRGVSPRTAGVVSPQPQVSRCGNSVMWRTGSAGRSSVDCPAVAGRRPRTPSPRAARRLARSAHTECRERPRGPQGAARGAAPVHARGRRTPAHVPVHRDDHAGETVVRSSRVANSWYVPRGLVNRWRPPSDGFSDPA